MKKIFTLLLVIAFSCKLSVGQSSKKVRFGLNYSPHVNWYTPDNQKKFEKGKNGLGFNGGLNLEFKITETAYVKTGLLFGMDKAGLTYTDSTYYKYADDKIITPEESFTTSEVVTTNYLAHRSHKLSYVTIPIAMKLKTKEIGFLTYFGEFGGLIGINTKARANDEITNLESGESFTEENINIDNQMQLLNTGLNVALGVEYNISGSTSLIVGLSWYYGFTNVTKGNNEYLYRDVLAPEPVAQKTNANFIGLDLGILF